MKILCAASEAAPFAHTGGLGDVAGALPKALSRFGHDVRLIMPLYRAVDARQHRLRTVADGLSVSTASGPLAIDVLEGNLAGGVPVYFVRHDPTFHRTGLYQSPSAEDYPDNTERFALFCRSVLEVCRRVDFQPEVLHAHDWQTALLPVYLKTTLLDDPFFRPTATVFTIHNLGYQGLFPPEVFPRLMLPRELFTPAGLEFYGKGNLLKGGLLFADLLTTVSPRYSREIQTADQGFGLDGVLRERRSDLFGVLNGIDPEEWNPAGDPHIVAHYTVDDLSGKARCKADLQRRLKLPVRATVPLLAVISRLAGQKGLDLLCDILETLMALNVQLVLLGSGEKGLETTFRDAAAKYPSKLAVRIGFDTPLSHQIEAGADLFLMPSRYEPCGLNQMYSLAYGTIPVVRATGGLDDTVIHFDPVAGQGNGFKFEDATPAAFLQTIWQALELYREKALWLQVITHAMTADFTWDRSAREYEQLYRRAVEKKGGQP
ncbi:glycogen synthase [Candidatus Methylomirabilis lanthanidiphila]|uniref:Glycogen synthase n=1 Tax=Candidatus Methylomirabilis lanthanidiphila TaxID=2211376 RepID=A0A564ZK00_9BACT|nr:glycogen synthase GlgA [Candidatus Methylomirabilis lanthanidiphila]VUZ85446.1 glycogen synthase [Candidatus Methylomirabilis lanthanidiphila]